MPESATRDLEPVFSLLEKTPEAALGTLEDSGPYVSAVGMLFERGRPYGRAYVLLSDLARHTRNLAKRPAASLLVQEKSETPVHERPRATLLGPALRLEDARKAAELKAAFLGRFPRAAVFFELPDFRFYEMVVREIHWIGGFGRAATFS